MQKILFGLSVLNSVYITNNLFTYSDSFLNAPLGVTTVIAVTLMFLNDSVKKDKPSLYTKATDWLGFINILIGLSLIVFI
ncbi:hypothetical protein ACV3PA_05920 [Exiguobacterium acetylicum]|uniref:hypothetical protein n=1 Tax=Exiguobacterium sp. BMC-KP TaxID=1684312 RepID=UPI0006AA5A67|nr:hypothetical protein [Exiguobacterium sp. BMC-KP]KOP30120.1 hypothetical protein ADM98_14905 [Exiguobacterium sp. BMC-KP]